MQARYYDPVIGRFLAADPIGFADQLNLYAYVHNDPVNNFDPTGKCTKNEKGEPVAGLCALDKPAGKLIIDAKKDKDSAVGEVDKELESKGKVAFVQTGTTDIAGQPVNGGVTEVGGENSDVVVVTIDLTDIVNVGGVNTKTNETETRDLTDSETLEHEIAGHVRDTLNGVPFNEENSFKAEDTYRERRGIPFKRTEYKGTIRQRGK